jgi:DNA-binding IclR family transcriptional regulator
MSRIETPATQPKSGARRKASAAKSHSDEGESGTSLGRMLRVLDLFTVDQPAWTLEAMTGQLGYTLSSGYRYVRELCAAGLLAAIGGGKYGLGPRVIELDRQLRLTDPVALFGREFVAGLLARIPVGAVMICALRGNQVVSVVAEKKPDTLDLRHERGHTMGLFLGSAAKAILVHLPNRRLSRLHMDFHEAIAAARLGDSWPSFMKTVATLRRQPYILTKGEFDPRNFALGAPIFYGAGQIAGSLNVIVPLQRYSDELVEQLASPLIEAARSMNARLADLAASHTGAGSKRS